MSRLAWPIVLTQLAWVGMLTTDTAMIGRLGAEQLAGATLSLMVFFLTYVICFGVVTATASLASQAFGARQPRQVRRITRQGWWVTIALTIPMLVAMGYTTDVLALMGQPEKTLPHAAAYMGTLMWSLLPATAFTVLRNFVSALGRPQPALWVMLSGVPLNALLDYGLIYGNFGLPRLELVGAGLATNDHQHHDVPSLDGDCCLPETIFPLRNPGPILAARLGSVSTNLSHWIADRRHSLDGCRVLHRDGVRHWVFRNRSNCRPHDCHPAAPYQHHDSHGTIPGSNGSCWPRSWSAQCRSGLSARDGQPQP